jgi:hypothetical protein
MPARSPPSSGARSWCVAWHYLTDVGHFIPKTTVPDARRPEAGRDV